VPTPVIANGFLVTFLWQSATGIRPRNTLACVAAGRNEEQIAAGFQASFGVNMWTWISSQFYFQQVEVRKLDGSSAGQVINVTEQDGIGGSEFAPQVAGVISLRTAQGGPRGRGRLYLGPVSEDRQTNGSMINTDVVTTAWQTFNTNLLALSPNPITLGVLSTVHGDFHALTTLFAEHIVATQRRRAERLRR
jgi:hypothetical protein